MTKRNKRKLSGSLGPGRIVVLQPSCSPAIIELAAGAQFWWAQSLTQLGRQAISTVLKVRDKDDRELVVADASAAPLPELALWKLLRSQVDLRFGLSSRFDLSEADQRLDVALRLFEQRGERFETLGGWTRSCSAPELAENVYELLREVAVRVGVRVPWGHWSAAFESGDAQAVMLYLRALGAFSFVDWRLHQRPEHALDAIVEVLRLDPQMGLAIAQLPALFQIVQNVPEVAPFTIMRAYRRAVDAVGSMPDAWRALDAELRSAL